MFLKYGKLDGLCDVLRGRGKKPFDLLAKLPAEARGPAQQQAVCGVNSAQARRLIQYGGPEEI